MTSAIGMPSDIMLFKGMTKFKVKLGADLFGRRSRGSCRRASRAKKYEKAEEIAKQSKDLPDLPRE